MVGLVEWLVTLIIFILVIGILYYILKRVMALVEVDPKLQEAILLGVLLVIVLFAFGFAFTGHLTPLVRFGSATTERAPTVAAYPR